MELPSSTKKEEHEVKIIGHTYQKNGRESDPDDTLKLNFYKTYLLKK